MLVGQYDHADKICMTIHQLIEDIDRACEGKPDYMYPMAPFKKPIKLAAYNLQKIHGKDTGQFMQIYHSLTPAELKTLILAFVEYGRSPVYKLIMEAVENYPKQMDADGYSKDDTKKKYKLVKGFITTNAKILNAPYIIMFYKSIDKGHHTAHLVEYNGKEIARSFYMTENLDTGTYNFTPVPGAIPPKTNKDEYAQSIATIVNGYYSITKQGGGVAA